MDNFGYYIGLLIALVVGILLIKKVASCLFRVVGILLIKKVASCLFRTVVTIILIVIFAVVLHYLGYF